MSTYLNTLFSLHDDSNLWSMNYWFICNRQIGRPPVESVTIQQFIIIFYLLLILTRDGIEHLHIFGIPSSENIIKSYNRLALTLTLISLDYLSIKLLPKHMQDPCFLLYNDGCYQSLALQKTKLKRSISQGRKKMKSMAEPWIHLISVKDK